MYVGWPLAAISYGNGQPTYIGVNNGSYDIVSLSHYELRMPFLYGLNDKH